MWKPLSLDRTDVCWAFGELILPCDCGEGGKEDDCLLCCCCCIDVGGGEVEVTLEEELALAVVTTDETPFVCEWDDDEDVTGGGENSGCTSIRSKLSSCCSLSVGFTCE